MVVSLINLTKAFPRLETQARETLVVNEVSLNVEDYEMLSLVGPSGSGKTTLIKLIAGIERPTSGTVRLNGQLSHSTVPQRRGVGVIFHEYGLIRRMTVAENIQFGLRVNKVPAKARCASMAELVDLMGLVGYEDRTPHELSMENRFRLAFARSLASRPGLMILDEPFRGMETATRSKLIVETIRWHQELRLTTILATRDRQTAWDLGNRVAVMEQGRIVRTGLTRDVLVNPEAGIVPGFDAESSVGSSGHSNGMWREILTKGDVTPFGDNDLIYPSHQSQTDDIPQPPAVAKDYSYQDYAVKLDLNLTKEKSVTSGASGGESGVEPERRLEGTGHTQSDSSQPHSNGKLRHLGVDI